MSTWNEFYQQIKDPSWPDCDREENFHLLPAHVQQECIENFGYILGSFKRQSKRAERMFPIKTETACQLKWNWSTVYLTTETTAGCHRTNHHKFDTNTFNFHNTPEKIADRTHMLQGNWPERGCDYCKDIELAGGQSDRITNLDFPGIHAPPELDTDLNAVVVTPRILEIYFDNTCNLKCVYCGPSFSSLWEAENKKFGTYTNGNLIVGLNPVKSPNIDKNKIKIFEWLKNHSEDLDVLNILGGEPLYQKETEKILELFNQYPAPELKLQMFTNLNTSLEHLQKFILTVQTLIKENKLREFEITASLDCWGPEQEFVRYPLDLKTWQTNFEYLVSCSWINLIVSSTITPLTIKTLPDLLERINAWGRDRAIYHYQNSVNAPRGYLGIDIFGDIFAKDFERALALKPETTPEQIASKKYLQGIAQQSTSGKANTSEITNLFNYLNELDRRRGTNWHKVFPWLEDEFAKYNLK